jgi:hypothetical protein
VFGIADAQFRMLELEKSLETLEALEAGFPEYFEQQKLTEYRTRVEARLKRLKPTAEEEGATPPTPEPMFAGFVSGFEKGDPEMVGDGGRQHRAGGG